MTSAQSLIAPCVRAFCTTSCPVVIDEILGGHFGEKWRAGRFDIRGVVDQFGDSSGLSPSYAS